MECDSYELPRAKPANTQGYLKKAMETIPNGTYNHLLKQAYALFSNIEML